MKNGTAMGCQDCWEVWMDLSATTCPFCRSTAIGEFKAATAVAAIPVSVGFIPRNAPSLVIVSDWDEFVAWARDGGYPESDLDVNTSRCMVLQEQYLEETATEGEGK